MAIVFVGVDLAKNVFAVHGVDEPGKPALICPVVKRDALVQLIAALPPCTIAMEACSGAHLVEQCTACINRLRGLLSEFGVVLPLKATTVRRQAATHPEDLPGWANTVIGMA